MSNLRELSGWGRWPRRPCTVATPRDPEAAARLAAGPGEMIARGMGRSYGASAMNPALTVETAALDRIIAFDPATGELTAEAGLTLGEIIDIYLPRGWFPPVTPGTKFVTLGGAIGADVHGKNHHAVGSFGHHVLWFDLALASGEIARCSPQENVELFNATIGGMGLTGIVLRVCTRLMRVESGYFRQKTLVAPNLDAAIAAFEAAFDATYSVAWIDVLAKGAKRGRSLIYLGEHAAAEEVPRAWGDPLGPKRRPTRRAPVDAPNGALNGLSVRAFNHVYFRAGAKKRPTELVDWDSYMYPLDSILEWNRMYGRRGFAQYQTVLPLDTARDALAEQLDAIAAAGAGSFLAVLKRMGPGAPERPFSFPMAGYTLALDFPLTPEALTLMDRLDEITLAAGGRLYLAKDARMTQATFEASYREGLAAFDRMARRDPASPRFRSLQSRSLGL